MRLQGTHQAPCLQRPSEFQHAAERTTALLQGAVEVISVSFRKPLALALDGLHHVSDDGLTEEGLDLFRLHITVLRWMGGSPTSAPHPPENLEDGSRPRDGASGDCKAPAG